MVRGPYHFPFPLQFGYMDTYILMHMNICACVDITAISWT
jgi:hypothetical protein